MRVRRLTAAAAAGVLAATTGAGAAVAASGTASAAVPATAPASGERHGGDAFRRTATYPGYLNRPAGEDPATPTVAEISAVTPDGRTLLSTDALARRIGFLDISDPDAPRGLGTLSLAQLGDAEDEPTSVAVHGGYALVVVNTSPGFTAPSGRLDVIRVTDRTRVRSIDLGGQPDSIAVSQDGRYAAIAIENERDEDAAPAGGEDGDLPQPPAGFVQIVDLTGAPASWTTRAVPLTAADGSALPALAAAGVAEPTDPEPEYVAVRGRQLAVTLQENNGLVLVDLPTGRVTAAYSAGTASVSGVDVEDDGTIDQTGSITDVPREPDAVAWLDDRYLAIANEGDWKGGTRGWSVVDSRTGRVAWDAGNSFERLAIAHGLHDDSRSDNKGAEPEGLAAARIGGTNYAFVGAERSNFVAVYDVDDPLRPRFEQVLPATNGPEGILPIPARGLVAISSEEDDAAAGVRAAVTLYQLGRGQPAFPSIVSADLAAPIGWGALSGLSALPGRRDQLVAVADAAYSPTKIATVDVSRSPARIVGELTVTDAAGAPLGVDAEGVFARPQGGYWISVEGSAANRADNRLLRLDAAGRLVETVSLPADVVAVMRAQGLEGVTATTDRAGHEQVWIAVQRELTTDPVGVTRLGRYDVASKTWAWFGYRLEATSAAGDFIGLSEIAVVGDRLAVIERDALNGPDARVKRVYSLPLPATSEVPAAGTLPVLPKTLDVDVLPLLRATNGWTQEKLEGLTVGGDGQVYAVTDNDGLDEATGETVFLRLGRADRVFRGGPTLLARAILPSDAYQPGPPSGAAAAPNNGVTPPFPGQPIPGFSAVLPIGGGEFWGMPDNGYGTKTNSADFLLRIYRVKPSFKTARGGDGSVGVLASVQLRDPDSKIPFALTREDRLLTGADFDLESVRRAPDGTFWFGEEFGPFLLHTSADGAVLEAPFALPGVQSPQNPYLGTGTPNLPPSRGFEGMALSADGKRLYPWLEGALVGDPDPRRRVVNEFDLAAKAYTGRTWTYRVDADTPNAVVGDVTALDANRYVLIERDDFQGVEARQKKIYLVDLRRTDASGALVKTLVLDLLNIEDPAGVSLPARPGEFGVGPAFSFPLQSVESVAVLGPSTLLIANDNNYPGSDGRWTARDRPDDTEMIVVDVPQLR